MPDAPASRTRTSARPPTLEDVAELAGVGRGTVSRVVNGSAHVSEGTRTAVLQAIDELGYVPNQAARALVTQTTGSVALVVSEPEERFFAEPFFAAVVRGVGRALAERDRQLVLSFASSSGDRGRLDRYLTRSHVDGVLLLSLHGDDPLPWLLEDRGMPTVLGGRPAGREPTCYVDVDNTGGARAAVEHLVATGRRRIATVAGPQDMCAGAERLAGYRAALGEAEPMVAYGDFSEASGRRAAARLLDEHPRLDSVFAASDPMATGVLAELAARGRRVPDDVAVVGFDDAPGSATTSPPLTTVHQPLADLGATMVRLLMERVAGEPAQPCILPTHLVVRASA